MTRFLWWLIGVPAGVVLVALAVANRQPVSLSLDPFSASAPALSLAVPVYMVIFGALILGVVLGGVAAWLNQGRYRHQARVLREDVAQLRAERGRVAPPEARALPAPRRAA